MPDYTKYSLKELFQAKNYIDKDKYPETYETLIEELKKRDPKELEKFITIYYDKDVFGESSSLSGRATYEGEKEDLEEVAHRFKSFFKKMFKRIK
jgi:hypothetical protein